MNRNIDFIDLQKILREKAKLFKKAISEDKERKAEPSAPEVKRKNVEKWNKIFNTDCTQIVTMKFNKYSKTGFMELQNFYPFLKELFS